MKKLDLTQFYRFGIVGVINTAIDLAILNLLIVLTHRGRSGGAYFLLFKAISFIAACTNSYFMNGRWTFQGTKLHSPLQTLRFLLITLIGLVVNVAVATSIATYVTRPWLEPYWPSIAAMAGTACGFLWNFIGYKRMVFLDETTFSDGPIQLGLHRFEKEDFAPSNMEIIPAASGENYYK